VAIAVIGKRNIAVFDTDEQAAAEGVKLFLDAAQDALAARGRFTVALSGGSSPVPLFRHLAEQAPCAGIDWGAVHIFWADERCVPPDHAESNFRLADQLFLSKLPAPGAVIHRIAGELSPAEAASRYEADLSRSFAEDDLPVFDMIMLGIGSDGHTASLFPGMDPDCFSGRKAVAVFVEKLQSHRVTLTGPLLSNARHLVFLVTGAAKAAILAEILGDEKGRSYPASRVASSSAAVTWLLDAEAAGEIKKTVRSASLRKPGGSHDIE
jgi:6-phosphogluconolactonase